MRVLRRARTIAAACLLALPACVAGPLVSFPDGPNQIDPERAAAIAPGMTRAQVLADFGPPDAVVREGSESAKSPGAPAALEVFRNRGRDVTGRGVYFYWSTESSTYLPKSRALAVAQPSERSGRKLWVLFNDVPGVVEDSVYRED